MRANGVRSTASPAAKNIYHETDVINLCVSVLPSLPILSPLRQLSAMEITTVYHPSSLCLCLCSGLSSLFFLIILSFPEECTARNEATAVVQTSSGLHSLSNVRDLRSCRQRIPPSTLPPTARVAGGGWDHRRMEGAKDLGRNREGGAVVAVY